MKTKEVVRDGRIFVFCTRTNAKEITDEEVDEFFEARKSSQFDFKVRDNKNARRIFERDLSIGIDFCVNKYNVPKEAIINEAHRLMPHHRIGE